LKKGICTFRTDRILAAMKACAPPALGHLWSVAVRLCHFSADLTPTGRFVGAPRFPPASEVVANPNGVRAGNELRMVEFQTGKGVQGLHCDE
jgi:hypothetical protein